MVPCLANLDWNNWNMQMLPTMSRIAVTGANRFFSMTLISSIGQGERNQRNEQYYTAMQRPLYLEEILCQKTVFYAMAPAESGSPSATQRSTLVLWFAIFTYCKCQRKPWRSFENMSGLSR